MNGSNSSLFALAAAVLAAACTMLASLPVPAAENPDRAVSHGLPEGLPPVPPGYATEDAINEAYKAGKLHLAPSPEGVPAGVREQANLCYSVQDGTELKLDLYLPDPDRPAKPLLVLIHGGGWSGGNKEDGILRAYAYYFVGEGYAVASIAYRLVGVAPYPAAVKDAMAAVAWLKEHAEQYGLDPGRVAVLGRSAGAHLAMMIGYAADSPVFNPSGADCRVHAVINLYGPTDLTTPYAREFAPVTAFLDASYGERPEIFAEASPLHHLTPDDPPTLIINGTIDSAIPISQADALAEALAAQGIAYGYDRVEGWHHSLDNIVELHDRTRQLVRLFLKSHLGGQ